MREGLSRKQAQKVISFSKQLRKRRDDQIISGKGLTIEDVLYEPQRRELAGFLLALNPKARTELIALVLLGRGDFLSFEEAFDHSANYADAGDQVIYLLDKALSLMAYLTMGIEKAKAERLPRSKVNIRADSHTSRNVLRVPPGAAY